MRLFTPLILSCTIVACSDVEKQSPQHAAADAAVTEATPELRSVMVQHFGALRIMMHQGDISAKVDMRDLADRPNLYALGAVAQLKGEILVLGGKAFIAKPVPTRREAMDGQVSLDTTMQHEAALLVTAEVAEWKSYPLPDGDLTKDELQTFIATQAEVHGLDPSGPFPFMIKGMTSFDWHVIDWPEGDREHSHEKHVTSGPHGHQDSTEVQILGFYSDHHHAVFTHHSTNLHMHVLTDDRTLAAHVDDLVVHRGAELFLPE